MTVRILTVCTGNICRSPYAQLVLQQRFDAVRPGVFEVSSVGTGALVGQGVDPGSASILDTAGVSHEGFAARQISEQLLEEVDLVLPLTVEHRATVLSYAPRLLKRCYTVKEAARLIESAGRRRPWAERLAGAVTPEQRWVRVPMELARERGMSRAEEGADDVADPYRREQLAFDSMAVEIDAAAEVIVGLEAGFVAG